MTRDKHHGLGLFSSRAASGSRRSSALDGLPVRLPEPAAATAPSASAEPLRPPRPSREPVPRRDTEPSDRVRAMPTGRVPNQVADSSVRTGTRERRAIELGEDVTVPTAPIARGRRSSTVTRQLQTTGRIQRPGRHDSIRPTPTANSSREAAAADTAGGESAIDARSDKPVVKWNPSQFSAVLHSRSTIRAAAPPPTIASPTTRASNEVPADRISGPRYRPSAPQRPVPSVASPTTRSSPDRQVRSAPVSDAEWQILTKGGAVIPLEFREIQVWKYGAMAVVGVSYRGQPWRDWDGFRGAVRGGSSGPDAWSRCRTI